ncbi:hypothetical protein M9Y10_014045 [Tritrichomonas musculus]|uniref:Uncharacterized protein n=1 Tax=Tritrichomonas musculus TaxID=1915356 RepID=A0ABR2KZC9_9EUKA
MILFILNVHYLTFDVYGTLLNTSPKKIAIKKIASDNNYPDPSRAYLTYEQSEDHCVYGDEYSDWDQKIRRALFWTDLYLNTSFFDTNESYQKIIEAYYSYQPFPEVIPTLKEMKNRGYTIVIMSYSANVLMDVNRKALEDLFEHCILAQESKAFKPSLKFFRYVHQKLDFDNNNHTHIAQGVWADILAATQMGWNKIWVNRDNERPSPEFEPYHVVSNLSQTLEYLPSLKKEKKFPWMIVGAGIAAAVLLIVIIIMIVVLVKRKKKQNLSSTISVPILNQNLNK